MTAGVRGKWWGKTKIYCERGGDSDKALTWGRDLINPFFVLEMTEKKYKMSVYRLDFMRKCSMLTVT